MLSIKSVGAYLARCAALFATVALLACGDEPGSVGSPCTEDDDCKAELICDIHVAGDDGTCQEPHEHD